MITRPIFKSIYDVQVVEPEGVFLFSEQEPFFLKGPLFCRIAPLLDGQHTIEDIMTTLSKEFGLLQTRFALAFLEQRDHIVEAHEGISAERAAMWQSLGVNSALAEERLTETSVSVRSFGEVPSDAFISALTTQGIRVEVNGDFIVALAEDYLEEGIAELNREMLETQRTWLLVKPSGTVLWMGPLFKPGKTACWECLAQRIRLNRSVDGYVQQRIGRSTPFKTARAALPASLQAACNIATFETVRAIIGAETETLMNTITTFDLLSRRSERHTVIQRPQCPICGQLPANQNEVIPIKLRPAPKEFTTDGGHRTILPEKTLERFAHHVSSITGIIRNLERTPVANAPFIHVFDSGENRSLTNFQNLEILRKSLRSRAGGKGVSETQARASAIGEALERYSGMLQGDEPIIRATYLELGEHAIHPNACMLYSEQQFAQRSEWNTRNSRYCRVPEPFDKTQTIEWTPVWSLTDAAPFYLPTSYCYYTQLESSRYAPGNSNGAAAGNTLEEAILQGFLELVERDSVALWWYNRIGRPAVDLDSFGEPYFIKMRETLKRMHRDLVVLDLSSDLGIPVFAAVSWCINQPQEQIIFGYGAHLSARVGILRAITEMNQFLPWVFPLLGQKKDSTDEMTVWLREATRINQPYLVPLESPPLRATDYPILESNDLRDDVLRCQSIVEAKGMKLLVLDQTRPDVGLAVAKVFVPGLRHFWTRFAPGRLYDVPVQLGWLSNPLTENELNPIPMFW